MDAERIDIARWWLRGYMKQHSVDCTTAARQIGLGMAARTKVARFIKGQSSRRESVEMTQAINRWFKGPPPSSKARRSSLRFGASDQQLERERQARRRQRSELRQRYGSLIQLAGSESTACRCPVMLGVVEILGKLTRIAQRHQRLLSRKSSAPERSL